MKDVACRENICKIDLFNKTDKITNFFSKLSVNFLKSNQKYVASSGVLGALLRAVDIQDTFFFDYLKQK